MKKRIFALALALCMMVSVMPNSFAAGILSVGDGTSTDTTIPSGGGILSVTGSTPSQLSNTGSAGNDGSALTPSVSQSSQSVSNTNTLSNPYSVDTIADEEDDNSAAKPYASEDLAQKGSATTVNGVDTTTASTGVSGVIAAAPVTSILIDYSSDNLVKRTKTISEPVDGKYTIELGAETEATSIITATARHIVLVLDASLDMKDDGVNNNATTLKNAVDAFISNVATDSPTSQIAIVSYADAAQIHTGENSYGTAFVSVTSDLSSVTQDVLDLTNGNTGTILGKRADLGLKEATRILQANNAVTGKPIVVLFTNGVPTENVKVTGNSRWNEDYDAYGIAQDSIHWGVILKSSKNELSIGENGYAGWGNYVEYDVNLGQSFYENWSQTDDSIFNEKEVGCNAEIYCVGVNLPDGTDGGYPGNDGVKINEFLYRVSSNRPDGSHDSRIGWWNYTNANTRFGYFLVGNMAGVGDLFDKVETDTSVKLNNIVVKDIVPAYMEIVSAEGGTISADKTTVTWTNVNLSPSSPISKTLVVKFKDGFLGGNAVPTNTTDSGLYSSENELIGAFGIPTVNVNAKEIVPDVRDQNVYLSNSTDLKLLIESLDSNINGVNNAYADVVYSILDASNQVVCTYTVSAGKTAGYWSAGTTTALTDDATYTVSCRVDAGKKSDGTDNYIDTINKPTAKVTIFKPHITFKDSTIYLGNWAYFEDNHEASCVSWLNASGAAANNMIGAAPAVSVVYSVDQENDGKLTDCTPVNVVKVTLGTDTATNYLSDTTFNADKHPGSENKDEFTVHIVVPSVEFQDSTIYLGHTPNKAEYEAKNVVKESGKDKITWTHIGSDGTATNRVGEPTNVTYTFEPTKDFTTCTPVDVTVKAGNLTYETVEDAFEVHVTKPVITSAGTTIYLGNSVNLKGQMAEGDYWYCDHTGDDEEKLAVMDGSNRLAPSIDHSFTVPEGADPITDETQYLTTNCVDVTVAATVNSKTAPIGDDYKTFTIHVIRPTITFADQDIYLSQTPVYAAPSFDWDETCADGCEGTLPENNSTDTETSFSYSYDVDPDKFVRCTNVNATVKIGTTDYTEYVTLKNTDGTTRNIDETDEADEADEYEHEFTVHVYLPQVVLESQNLWADYDCDVTLTAGMKDASISKWSNQCNSTEKKEHSTNAPQCSDPVYEFTLDDKVITTYNAKDEEVTDQSTIDVALDKIKIGGIEYEFSNVDSVEYTITVNKFDLTINKVWKDGEKAADGTYKQDAIFTVAHEDFGSFKVVLPAGQPNVKVTGLLCGQDYSVTEDDAWTWRWEAEKTVEFATHEHDVSTSAPTEHVNLNKTAKEDTTSVSFTNSLINRLWLSFCTFVQNIFAAVTTTEGGN